MVERESKTALRSNGGAFQNGSDPAITCQSESDDADWFAGLAQPLLGKDAGLALHYLTGFPESSCYNYAAGRRKAPGYLIVALLRSPQGAQWLNAFMYGSDAPWWVAHQRNQSVADKAREFVRTFE